MHAHTHNYVQGLLWLYYGMHAVTMVSVHTHLDAHYIPHVDVHSWWTDNPIYESANQYQNHQTRLQPHACNTAEVSSIYSASGGRGQRVVLSLVGQHNFENNRPRKHFSIILE